MDRETSPVLSQEQLPSSPPLPTPRRHQRPAKIKKPPPITPKRFNRFFNPRSSSSVSSKSSRALNELTSSGVNKQYNQHALDTHDDLESLTPRKRIKHSHRDLENVDPELPLFSSSPPLSSPCQKPESTRPAALVQYPKPIVRSRPQKHTLRSTIYTSDFVTTSQDRNFFTRENLPFSTAACNTNSLVAIGTEQGEIRLLESDQSSKPPFSETFHKFSPHQNAIMDLAFTSDDLRLASASGDQTARIIDMRTQTSTYVLAEHTASLKQVCFLPGNEDIVATCSRDSVVALWDLRCATSGPVMRNQLSPDGEHVAPPRYASMYKAISNSVLGNFKPSSLGSSPPSTPSSSAEADKRSAKTAPRESNTNRPKRATTSIAFIPQSPHHLVTSSDASSHLRVWDIRSRQLSTRTRSPMPIQYPVSISASWLDSHGSGRTSGGSGTKTRLRDYGITSVCLGSDGARLYAVSRDNSVHVYSTSHLILGQAYGSGGQHARSRTCFQGAPPLYSLRNPSLRVGSFYIRAAVRRTGPSSHGPELLAVGSSESKVVLFATDAHSNIQSPVQVSDGDSTEQGTALIGGHTREVCGLAWTCKGELISCGDDSAVRVWREDREKARRLRNCSPRDMHDCGVPDAHQCGWSLPRSSWTAGVDHDDSDEE